MPYTGAKAVIDKSDVIKTKCILNNGQRIPVVGLGTYLMKEKSHFVAAVDYALEIGYRLFDTATAYGNEEFLGEALKICLPKHNLQRSDIFIVSKLSPKEQGSSKAKKAVNSSLKKLQVAYIDLYLIHWPGVSNLDVGSKDNKELRKQSWVELENFVDQGVLKSIGVSNYTLKHLQDLYNYCRIEPVLNQVEYHVHFRHPNDFMNFCGSKNLLLQSYSTLGGENNKAILEDPTVAEVSYQLNATRAQILLRWALQKGWAVIPKSVNKERLLENSKLNFEIPTNLMEMLDFITTRKKYSWNPDLVS